MVVAFGQKTFLLVHLSTCIQYKNAGHFRGQKGSEKKIHTSTDDTGI